MATKDGKKTGGRKAGVPNKKTVKAREVLALIEEHAFNPLEFMLQVASGKPPKNVNAAEITLDMRIACAKELAQYIAPKRKAIEGAPNDGNPIEMVVRWQA